MKRAPAMAMPRAKHDPLRGVAVLAALALPVLAAKPSDPPEGVAGPRWREGPVRYLLTAEEEREVRSLAAKTDIEEFVRRFWLRRDPTPDTPANEFHEEFRRRLRAVNHRFTETTTPGWRTDRGKIYILLGPPDEESSVVMEAGRRSVVVWEYRSPPQPDLGPQTAVRFVQDASGEYRLSADAFADSRVLLIGGEPAPGQIPGPPPTGEGSELYNRIQQSRLQDVPVVLQTPRVSVSWSAIGDPFSACAGYYLSEDGSTLAALTLEVDPSFLREDPEFKPEDLRVLGHLGRLDGPGRLDLGTLTPFTPHPESSTRRPLRYQALQSLRPGKYRAYFALVDKQERLRASFHEDFIAPEIPARSLALSGLSLVDELGQASPPPRIEPFVIGRLRVVPRCRAEFAAGEELGLYYQIYGGRTAGEGEPPELNIEYHFEYLLEERSYPIGQPLRIARQTGRAQGQTFRLSGWLPGRYRLSLTVSDPVDGSRAMRELDFEIR